MTYWLHVQSLTTTTLHHLQVYSVSYETNTWYPWYNAVFRRYRQLPRFENQRNSLDSKKQPWWYGWLSLVTDQQLTICTWAAMTEHVQIVSCCSATNDNHPSPVNIFNCTMPVFTQATFAKKYTLQDMALSIDKLRINHYLHFLKKNSKNRHVIAYHPICRCHCELHAALLYSSEKLSQTDQSSASTGSTNHVAAYNLSLIHIWRCRRIERCRSRWSPYH